MRNAAIMENNTVIQAVNQTAGRGQKGNSWESAPGKNATFSHLIKQPRVAVKEQFFLSEAVSLAIVDALENYATGFKIKWPNDIYYGDSKICGILIEVSLNSTGIEHVVAGIGINVNQRLFISDAPNPISLVKITGEKTDVAGVIHSVCENIENYCNFDGSRRQLDNIHKRYLDKLYRYDGMPHTFTTPDGAKFQAIMQEVKPDGTLVLNHCSDNTLHNYLFKEVGFVIDNKRFI